MWAKLPTEVLLQIFNHLEPVFLLRTVAQVCVRFKQILLDDGYLRLSYFQHLYGWCPEVEDVPLLRHWDSKNPMGWRDRGRRLQAMWENWQNPAKYTFRGSVCPVDAVRLLKDSRICLVGNREKSIDMWQVGGAPEISGSIPDAHGGWVTAIDSYDGTSFVSGGWDSIVKLWQVREHSGECVWAVNCHRGVMSVAARHDIIAVASFSPFLNLIDPRDPRNVLKYQIHVKAIADIALTGNHVVSVARDRALNVFDLRMMDTVLRRSRFAGTVKGGLPKCLSAQDNIVYVGDSFGYVHLLDSNVGLRAFHSIPVAGPKETINCIIPDSGTILCGASDGILRIIAPSKPHYVIAKIGDAATSNSEITSMSYDTSILAVGKTSGYVSTYLATSSKELIQ